MARSIKVAIVGSGLAGLTATYLLSRPNTDVEFEVHLFEKASELGMDCSSVSLPSSGSRTDSHSWRVDVPMRSFQGGYYPQLMALYTRLGVNFRVADFSYSFSLLTPPTPTRDKQINATMLYNGASGVKGLSMPEMLDKPYRLTKGQNFLIRAVTRIWTIGIFVLLTAHVTLCYLRTILHAFPLLRDNGLEYTTFEAWAEQTVPTSAFARWTRMDIAWRHYTQAVLLPLFSAVCTAPQEDVLHHPVEEFLDYIWLTLGTHHYVVKGGVREVVEKLTAETQHIHLSSTVLSIYPDPQDPRYAAIHCDTPNGSIVHTGFHHIIFATQATRATPLLSSYKNALDPMDGKRQAIEAQLRCLQAFEYRTNIVINHTDPSFLPDSPGDQRELNLVRVDEVAGKLHTNALLDGDANTLPSSYTMATQVLQPPADYQGHLPVIFQTTNPIIPPKKDSILSIARLERAVLTVKSKEALKGLYQEGGRKCWQCPCQAVGRLGELQGAGRLSKLQGPGIWICGSFACAGIPLLEGCVISARSVVEQGIGISEGLKLSSPPW